MTLQLYLAYRIKKDLRELQALLDDETGSDDGFDNSGISYHNDCNIENMIIALEDITHKLFGRSINNA